MVYEPKYTFKKLKNIHNKRREDFEKEFSIRINRALSWLQRAEQENTDDDAKFIFLWISFNAAYAMHLNDVDVLKEKDMFLTFFNTALSLNKTDISDYIFKRFSNEIKGILDNEFILSAYWKSVDSGMKTDWKNAKIKSKSKVYKALSNDNPIDILKELFNRLYVLRNQIMHGGATWNGRLNRNQVKDGTKFLMCVIPIFIKIMMDNPDADWGKIAFPASNS